MDVYYEGYDNLPKLLDWVYVIYPQQNVRVVGKRPFRESAIYRSRVDQIKSRTTSIYPYAGSRRLQFEEPWK